LLYAQNPRMVSFEPDETERIERAQVALLLHITPQQVDEMPYQDMMDVIAMDDANKRLEQKRMQRMMKQRR